MILFRSNAVFKANTLYKAKKLWCVLGVLAVVLWNDSVRAAPQQILLIHANIVDVNKGTVIPNQDIRIDDGKIASLNDSGDAPDSVCDAETIVVDLTGKYVIPGLWDMHIHWYDQRRMQLFPINGVTGVRVMVGMPMHRSWRNSFAEGSLLGPRMMISSPIIDGPKPIWPGSLIVGNTEQAGKVVRNCIDANSDFLKVYSLLPRAAYFEIAKQAKENGIPFAGHVPYSVTMSEASDAGQNSMEHLYELFIACSSQEDELRKMRDALMTDPTDTRALYDNAEVMRTVTQRAVDSFDETKAQQLFEKLATNKSWQCPTLTVLRNLAYLETAEIQDNPNLKYFPSAFRKTLAPEKDKSARDAQAFARSQKLFQFNLELVKKMHDAQVPLLAGTDCLNPFCLPGFSLHDELQLMVRAGLTPAQALQTATINPAIFQGKESELGSVEKDKLADIVVLDENPLDDIRNTQRIFSVIVRGTMLTRSQLDERLNDFIETK